MLYIHNFRAEKDTEKLPSGVTPYIGEGDVIMNRETAHFAVNHPQAKSVLKWAEKTQHPQQTFYATLNYNPRQFKIKGSYTGQSSLILWFNHVTNLVNIQVIFFKQHFKKKSLKKKTDYQRFITITCAYFCLNSILGPLDYQNLKSLEHIAKFVDSKNASSHACHGSRSFHGYCTFGVGDLPYLINRKELFAFRFRWDIDRLVLQCMEQMIYQRSKEQFMYPKDYDLSFYKHLEIVKHQLWTKPEHKN